MHLHHPVAADIGDGNRFAHQVTAAIEDASNDLCSRSSCSTEYRFGGERRNRLAEQSIRWGSSRFVWAKSFGKIVERVESKEPELCLGWVVESSGVTWFVGVVTIRVASACLLYTSPSPRD